jgi:hypothetical protein
VVDVGLTTRLLPVPTDVPPQLPVIHLRVVPAPPVAVSVELAPEQIEDGLADADVGAVGDVQLTVTPADTVLGVVE